AACGSTARPGPARACWWSCRARRDRGGSPSAALPPAARAEDGAAMRVVIAEDHLLTREGLSLVLTRAGLEIVAVAGDSEELVRKASAHRPDLVVADIRMPPTHTDDGLRAALELRERMPGLPVLLLSQYVQRRFAVALLESGEEGVGY